MLSSARPQWWFIADVVFDRELAPGGSAEVQAEVRAGEVGLSFVGEDESRPWSEHVAGPGTVTAHLQVSTGDPTPRRILLRSCAPDDRPAVVELRSVRLFTPG
ncbi:MAG: hypothetical protein ABGY24_12540 [bacterium]